MDFTGAVNTTAINVKHCKKSRYIFNTATLDKLTINSSDTGYNGRNLVKLLKQATKLETSELSNIKHKLRVEDVEHLSLTDIIHIDVDNIDFLFSK